MREVLRKAVTLGAAIIIEDVLGILALLFRQAVFIMLKNEVKDGETIIDAVFENADPRKQDAGCDMIRCCIKDRRHEACCARVIANHKVAVCALVEIFRRLLLRLNDFGERVDDIGVLTLLVKRIKRFVQLLRCLLPCLCGLLLTTLVHSSACFSHDNLYLLCCMFPIKFPIFINTTHPRHFLPATATSAQRWSDTPPRDRAGKRPHP